MNVARVIDAGTEPAAVVVEEVAAVIFGGGTVIFPTDTVYGIGCDPYDGGAIDRIYGAKNRPDHKPLTLHVASVREFVEYAPGNARAIQAGRRLMPGPVTLIVRRPTFIDEDVTSGLPTLGFRVPDDELCLAILDRCGPLAATSANTSGSCPYFGAGDWEQLPPADLLVENGLTHWQRESTVIDFAGPHPRLLREGVVGYERLTELIGPVERHAIKVRNTR